MDQFFQQQRAEGATDSSGTFTISPDLARKKLKLFQLAEPDSYLLKAVQAAVAVGAPELDFKIGRHELRLSFPCSDPTVLEPVRLASALLEVHSLPDGPLRHLTLAVNAASACSLKELRWETPRGRLRLTDDALECEQELVFEGHSLVLAKKRSLLDWFRGSLFTGEIQHVLKRCHYAPLAITIDGKSMDRPSTDRLGQHVDDDLGLRKPYYLLEHQFPGDKLWLAPPEAGSYVPVEGQYRLWTDRFTREPVPLLLRGPQPEESIVKSEMIVGIQPRWNGEGSVVFVKDGVTLTRLAADVGHPRAAVVCDGAGLTLDMSEFSVVEDGKLGQRLAEIRRCVGQVAAELKDGPLLLALERAEMPEAFRASSVERLRHWLRDRHLNSPLSFRDLLEQTLPHAPPLYLSPEIPAEKEVNFRRLHADHLPEEEKLLALFDDNLLGGAKTGFGISESRLCWRGTLDACGVVLWEHLQLHDLTVDDGKVLLMGAEIPAIMKKEVAGRLADFLRQVGGLNLPRVQQWQSAWEQVLFHARYHLGLQSYIYYHPYIPSRKLRHFKASVRPHLNDQVPLVYYDDTLFGKGDVGVVVTERMLLYKNSFGNSFAHEWSALRGTTFRATSSGVGFGDEEITVCREKLRWPLAKFFDAIRAAK